MQLSKSSDKSSFRSSLFCIARGDALGTLGHPDFMVPLARKGVIGFGVCFSLRLFRTTPSIMIHQISFGEIYSSIPCCIIYEAGTLSDSLVTKILSLYQPRHRHHNSEM